jgi:hypothetical protein
MTASESLRWRYPSDGICKIRGWKKHVQGAIVPELSVAALFWEEGLHDRGCLYHKVDRQRVGQLRIQIDVFVMPEVQFPRSVRITVNGSKRLDAEPMALDAPGEGKHRLDELMERLDAVGLPRAATTAWANGVVQLLSRDATTIAEAQRQPVQRRSG